MTGLTQCLASMPAPRPTPTTATQHAKSPDIGPMAVPIALFSLFIAIQHAIPYGIGPMSAPSAFLNPTAAKQHAILHDIGPMSGATAFNAFSTTSGHGTKQPPKILQGKWNTCIFIMKCMLLTALIRIFYLH